MIIQNKFVKIKTNAKAVDTHNYICDQYIKNINLSQFANNIEDFANYNMNKILYYCCIKFDTPVELENASFTDFDVAIRNQSYNVSGAKDRCNATYIYNSAINLTKTTDINENVNINDYTNKKIVSIGFFNSNFENESFNPQLLAYLDVSDYSIIITENEKLVITRSDDFITNMETVGFDFPMHLAPFFQTADDGEPVFARLYSIGFGTSKGKMREEYKLDDDEISIEKTNTSFSFFIKTGEEHTLYPSINLYSSNGKYPMKAYQFVEGYPTENIYPSNSKYPLRSNVKYIIFKYKLCHLDYEDNLIDLNTTYTMNYYSPKLGLLKINNKLERRN